MSIMKRTVLAMFVALLTASPLAAQWLNHPTPGLPRTPDGKPDLAAPTPRTHGGTPDLSGIWRLNGIGYVFNIFGGQHVEMLPWAQDVYAKRSMNLAKDSPDTNCLPPGPHAGLFAMAPVKFVQTPGLLLILYEDAPTRQVFMDGRGLPTDPNPTWMGYSVGRWDGDTLVVETAGFNDRTWLDFTGHPHTEALHMTERFRRLNVGRMQLEMTFDDPKTYTKPWTIAIDVDLMPDTDLLENVCNENERDGHRLVGHVDDEKAREIKVSPSVLAKYAGVYFAGPLGKIRILADGDQLAMELPVGGARHPAMARSEDDFFVPAIGGSLTFLKNANQDVTHARITIVEGDIDAPRIGDATKAGH
jgi:hypothetical protein